MYEIDYDVEQIGSGSIRMYRIPLQGFRHIQDRTMQEYAQHHHRAAQGVETVIAAFILHYSSSEVRIKSTRINPGNFSGIQKN